MKRNKNSSGNKKWLWLLLLFIPNCLMAQRLDSLTYKKGKLYFAVGWGVGMGFGNIDPNPDDRQKSGIFAKGSLMAIRNKIYAETRLTSYSVFDPFSNNMHIDTYDVLAGRVFPVAEKTNVSLGVGLGMVKWYRHDDASPGGSFINRESGSVNIPVEFKYSYSEYKFVCSSLSACANFNNQRITYTVSLDIMFGNLREKLAVKDRFHFF